MGWVDVCLLDTGCLAGIVASLCGGLAAAKRLYVSDLWGGEGFWIWALIGTKKIIGAAAINGAAAAALVVLAVEAATVPPKQAASLTILLAICMDFATTDGRAVLSKIIQIAVTGTHSGHTKKPPSPPAA